jgi:hypothetical protein
LPSIYTEKNRGHFGTHFENFSENPQICANCLSNSACFHVCVPISRLSLRLLRRRVRILAKLFSASATYAAHESTRRRCGHCILPALVLHRAPRFQSDLGEYHSHRAPLITSPQLRSDARAHLSAAVLALGARITLLAEGKHPSLYFHWRERFDRRKTRMFTEYSHLPRFSPPIKVPPARAF